VLAANFLGVVRGDEESVSSIENGLLNALLCLKAKESATHWFQGIQWPTAGV